MAKQSRLRVAVVQTACTLGDVHANAERHASYIREADAAGAELILFPELSLTGYRLGSDMVRVSMDRHDPVLAELAAVAPNRTVVLGMVEEGYAAQFYNSAVALRGGEAVFVHRKLNLPTYGNLEEGKLFAGGRYIELLDLGGPWHAGVLICADLWNPALVHLAVVHGATLLLGPVNSAVEAVGGEFSNPHGWRLTVEFYSMMYGMPTLFANRVGTEGDARFWGGSRILGAHGEELAATEGDEERMLLADLDYDSVRRARFQLPTVRDSNLNLVHREIERLATRVGVPDMMRRP